MVARLPDQGFSVIDNDHRLFRMSLKAQDRQSLVKLMAGYDEWADDEVLLHAAVQPGASAPPHLARLAHRRRGQLGGPPRWVDLEQWRHLASLGRDAYVRVVYRGYLLPFGHNAALFRSPSANSTARWRSREANRHPAPAPLHRPAARIVDYSGEGHVHDGRGFPFERVELLTRITPDLKDPGFGKSRLVADGGDQIYGGEITNDKAFWPMIAAASGAATDFPFDVLATDIAGEPVAFSMPMLFVSKEVNKQKSAEVRRAYNRPSPSGAKPSSVAQRSAITVRAGRQG